MNASEHRHDNAGVQVHDEIHRAPSDCPVCGDQLRVTRLGCTSCGTELAGVFRTCEFCALNPADIETLRVFLASRGNLREVEKHLGVSYPTARLRLTQLLMRLGLSGEADAAPPIRPSREDVLAQVAAGDLSPAEAGRLLAEAE